MSEAASSHHYPQGYRPKPLADQIALLRETLPVSPRLNFVIKSCQSYVEGWFAIPRWQAIASTYNEAVDHILALISQTRNGKFYSWCQYNTGPNVLRQHELSIAMWQRIADQQSGADVLIVPVQFGLRHRGRSVGQARDLFVINEFGLGAFAVGIMLLTHPERLNHVDDLWIDCAGDEYDDLADDDRFSLAPCFGFDVGRVSFGAFSVVNSRGYSGSASAFVP